MELNIGLVRKIVESALYEDIGSGDITSLSIVSEDAQAEGEFICEAPGVIAGLFTSQLAFELLDDDIEFKALVFEGERVKIGSKIATVKGKARSILAAERTALNFLRHLSGVATYTTDFVQRVKPYTKVRIVDTRKTMPGLRILEKYAVRVGGGYNHRFGLYDSVLIKENHITIAGSVSAAIKRAKAYIPHTMKIEVEAEAIDQVKEALEAGADIIMLDNMNLDEMREAVELVSGRVMLEASGKINLDNVADVAMIGVDIISVGAITHSAKALDISLELKSSRIH